MIKTEIVTIKGKKYKRTYSSEGYMIEREGVQYSEAIDPIGSDRKYVETETKIEEDNDGEII